MLTKFVRPSHATVVAYLALFIALGGTSYAAVTLPGNSVGTKQIKPGGVKSSDLGKNAVKTGNVKDGSLLSLDFQPGQLPAGAQGATGSQGLQGLKGDKGDRGTNGTDGAVGAPGPFPATLPSGKTLKGLYAASDRNGPNGTPAQAIAEASISFPFPLASPPTVRLVALNTTTPECQGTIADPTAAAGNVCIYRSDDSVAPSAVRPDGFSGSGKTGLFLYFGSLGHAYGYGTWAVTAP